MRDWIHNVSLRKILVLTSYFFLIISVFLSNDSAGSVVSDIEVRGLYSIGKDELLYLLDISPGDKLDTAKVREGIKRAFLKGIFEDISVETIPGEKDKVIISVKERDFIKKIYIEGGHNLPRKTIKKLFL